MIGTKLCSPWTTPQRLTSKTQRQSSSVWSRIRLNVETPALLHSTSTRPNRASVPAANRSTAAASATFTSIASASPPDARMPAATASASARVEVGHHDRRTGGRERLGQGPPDAAGGAGHHRHLARADHLESCVRVSVVCCYPSCLHPPCAPSRHGTRTHLPTTPPWAMRSSALLSSSNGISAVTALRSRPSSTSMARLAWMASSSWRA